MPERNFFESLGSQMMFHKFAMEKLTEEERAALDEFDKAYDAKIEGTELTNEEEGRLVKKLLDDIPMAREAFNKFNSIVENLEKQARRSGKFKLN